MMKLKTFSMTGRHIFVGNHLLVSESRWINWEVRSNWYRYNQIKPYLEEWGVRETDKVISLSDYSFSTSLWYLNLRGWTNFKNISTIEEMQVLIEKGAKYLILGNDDLQNQDFIVPFTTNKIGEFEKIKVYKLSD